MSEEIRIVAVTLVNYRPYYGTVKINFPTEENVFTVLIGANGAGKSSFWNAIHWCLFGIEPHMKTPNAKPIINEAYLLDAEENAKRDHLSMSVEIIMKHGDKKYRIRRQMRGMLQFLERDKNGMVIMSKEDPVPYGFEIRRDGNSVLFQQSVGYGPWKTLSNTHDFDNLVSERVLPKNLSHFFILDGEFLQELFGKFENIKSGIDQIAQIHVLNDALDLVENTRFNNKIRSTRDAVDIDAKIRRIDQFLNSEDRRGVRSTSTTEFVYGTEDPMHTSGKPRMADLKRAIGAMDDRIRKLGEEIASADAVNKTNLRERHKEKLKERREAEEHLKKLTEEHLSLLITEGPFIMCRQSMMTATDLIRGEMEKGKLPNIPRLMLVSDLLSKQECLCGTPLTEGTHARKLVENEMMLITDEAQYDIANDIRYNNDQSFKNYDDTLNRMNAGMRDIHEARTNLEKLAEEIRELQRQLPKEDEDYGRLISEKSGLMEDRDILMKELGAVESDIRTQTGKRGDEMRKLSALNTQVREEREAILLLEKSGIIGSKIRDIKRDVDRTIRERVSRETLKIFNDLSWKKNYSKLMIDDKYHIRVTDDDGFETVGGMSAGENLFLALSFIMALKRVTNYKFPFVIDSPLGKTGGNLRIRFGRHMPELLDGTQIIMLATNTEYNDNPLIPEDGGKPEPSLIKLLKEKTEIREYKIDFDKERKAATILTEEAA